jgi:hypothetical protein
MSYNTPTGCCDGCDGFSYCFCVTCTRCGRLTTKHNRTDVRKLCDKCIRAMITWVDLGTNGFQTTLPDGTSLLATYAQGWTFTMWTGNDVKSVREYKLDVASAKLQAVWYLRGWLVDLRNEASLRYLNGET